MYIKKKKKVNSNVALQHKYETNQSVTSLFVLAINKSNLESVTGVLESDRGTMLRGM